MTGALAEAERRRRWAAALVAVDAWIRRNGGLYPLPPVDMKMPDGRSLHSWILNARQAYRYGELARWQVETAEAVDGWTWATRRRRRSDTGRTKPGQLARVGLLKAWTDVHGPLPAAGPLTGDDDGELAGIRDRLRTHRRGAERGRYRPLAADVIAAADALPGWTWEIQPSGPRVGAVSPYQRARWWRNYHRFAAAVAADPTVQDTDPWAAEQRRRGHATDPAGKLRPEQRDAMDAVPGWCWDTPSDRAWRARAETARKYLATHNRFPPCRPGGDHTSPEALLHAWLVRVLRYHNTGTLPPRRRAAFKPVVDELDRLAADAWELTYTEIRGRLTGRRSRLPLRGQRTWLEQQAAAAAEGKLTDWQRSRLEQLQRIIQARHADRDAGQGVSSFAEANTGRAAGAGQRHAAEARAVLDRYGNQLRDVDREILQARVDHPTWTLTQLGEHLGIGKDAAAGRLRRALTDAGRWAA